mmetsp:Transcript_22785/g.50159  ORF Transcript_22785/g.50159 Transcript_22785/m.50159 type:complete len:673 (+) Transcript_22785:86-2104(+)
MMTAAFPPAFPPPPHFHRLDNDGHECCHGLEMAEHLKGSVQKAMMECLGQAGDLMTLCPGAKRHFWELREGIRAMHTGPGQAGVAEADEEGRIGHLHNSQLVVQLLQVVVQLMAFPPKVCTMERGIQCTPLSASCHSRGTQCSAADTSTTRAVQATPTFEVRETQTVVQPRGLPTIETATQATASCRDRGEQTQQMQSFSIGVGTDFPLYPPPTQDQGPPRPEVDTADAEVEAVLLCRCCRINATLHPMETCRACHRCTQGQCRRCGNPVDVSNDGLICIPCSEKTSNFPPYSLPIEPVAGPFPNVVTAAPPPPAEETSPPYQPQTIRAVRIGGGYDVVRLEEMNGPPRRPTRSASQPPRSFPSNFDWQAYRTGVPQEPVARQMPPMEPVARVPMPTEPIGNAIMPASSRRGPSSSSSGSPSRERQLSPAAYYQQQQQQYYQQQQQQQQQQQYDQQEQQEQQEHEYFQQQRQHSQQQLQHLQRSTMSTTSRPLSGSRRPRSARGYGSNFVHGAPSSDTRPEHFGVGSYHFKKAAATSLASGPMGGLTHGGLPSNGQQLYRVMLPAIPPNPFNFGVAGSGLQGAGRGRARPSSAHPRLTNGAASPPNGGGNGMMMASQSGGSGLQQSLRSRPLAPTDEAERLKSNGADMPRPTLRPQTHKQGGTETTSTRYKT